jgi:hypothetical protein
LESCRVILETISPLTVTMSQWASSTIIALVRGRRHSLNVTSAVSRQLDLMHSAVVHGELAKAEDVVASLGLDIRIEDCRLRRLLADLLAVMRAGDLLQAYAARRALARMILYVYYGYKTGWEGQKQAFVDDPESWMPHASRLYWWLQITNARSQGVSIPFDCLRLARERVTTDLIAS